MVSVGGRWEPGQAGGRTKGTPTRRLVRRAGPPVWPPSRQKAWPPAGGHSHVARVFEGSQVRKEGLLLLCLFHETRMKVG